MKRGELIKAARELGREHGTAAASWYFDEGRNNVTREDYQRVLAGLNDLDPEIMDTLPNSPLSGEFADGLTPRSLLMQLGENEETVSAELQDELCNEYESEFTYASQDAVERECLARLEQDVTFTISVSTDQDPAQLLSKLTDLLARENCSLDADEFEVN